MTAIYYSTDSRLTPRAKEILRGARALAYGKQQVDFQEVEPGVGSLNFGYFPELPDDAVRTMSFREMPFVPHAEFIIAAAMRRYRGTFEYRSPAPGKNILWFDTEAHSVDDRWRMDPREYTRLFQYAWNDDPEVHLTTDYDEMIALIESADVSVAQQGILFDLSTLYGKDSIRPLELARDGRVFDPKVFAAVNFPAPPFFTDRRGRYHKDANAPGNAAHGWFSLDNLAYQFGAGGKLGDLKELAEEYGGFGVIPLDDPRFVDYAKRDVTVLRDNTSAMLQFASPDSYDWREMLVESINAQIMRNGVKLHKGRARARVAELAIRKDQLLAQLTRDYGFPTEGKAPWSSKAGRAAIVRILQDGGVDPTQEPWPQGKTGPSLGGPVLSEQLAGTDLEETGTRLAELMGQRPLAAQALMYVQPDGKVHPEINVLQRSGRSSITRPGLTTWGNRDPKLRIEKSYFVPDGPSQVMIEMDLAQADARIVAAYSGDTAFAKRFEPGADAHELTGRLVFGDAVYESDPAKYRQMAKVQGHAYAYGAGARTLAMHAKLPIAITQQFVNAMKESYPDVTAWQKKVVREAEMTGGVTNDWGRWMPVDAGREFTTAPALYGQSGTRELLLDALIRMLDYDIRLIQWVKMTVHDAIVWSVPKREVSWVLPKLKELMACSWGPSDGSGQMIDFEVTGGDVLGSSWMEASH